MSKIKSLDAPDASELIKEMAVQDWVIEHPTDIFSKLMIFKSGITLTSF
jgi:hypothetical protein